MREHHPSLRPSWAALVGLLVAVVLTSATTIDPEVRSADGPADDPRLAIRIHVEFMETHLGDALAYLSELLRIPITVDWSALCDAGIKAETRVDVSFHDAAAGTVLRLVLEVASGDPKAAGFVVEKDGVLVTSVAKRPDAMRPPRTDPAHEPNVATREILQKMHPRIMRATRPNVPLSAVLSDMQKWYGIDIIIFERSVERASFDRDAPIVEWNPDSYDAETLLRQFLLQAQGVDVREAIDRAANTDNASIKNLSMRIDDGLVIISRAEE